jgi:peptidoglycan/LPS O-acetylase OafA/YrhL
MAATTELLNSMNRWTRRLIVVAITMVGSVLTFWTLLRISPPSWETSEYPAMAFWSLPLGLMALLVAKLPRRWLARSSIFIRVIVSAALAGITAVVWTYLAVWLTGGYALAFDANPFVCWAVGSLLGMLTAINWPTVGIERPNSAQAAI